MIGVTGATGFVGRAVVSALADNGLPWKGFSFSGGSVSGRPTEAIKLDPDTDWRSAVSGIHTLVHCAARVHQMDKAAARDESAFQAINVEGTLQLARQAAEVGVRRFVFLSSIKVHGEETAIDTPFRHDSPLAPEDAYGRSKRDAEKALREVANNTGLELVVIRPPLVYGPGVGANFRALMKLVASGLPLPFASIQNRRSMVGVQNLADLVMHCCIHTGAPGQTFLVSDNQDLSTPQLVRELASAMGCGSRLFPCPPGLLEWGAKSVGRGQQAERLTRSLCVDIQHTIQGLDWHPKLSVRQGLALTVDALTA